MFQNEKYLIFRGLETIFTALASTGFRVRLKVARQTGEAGSILDERSVRSSDSVTGSTCS